MKIPISSRYFLLQNINVSKQNTLINDMSIKINITNSGPNRRKIIYTDFKILHNIRTTKLDDINISYSTIRFRNELISKSRLYQSNSDNRYISSSVQSFKVSRYIRAEQHKLKQLSYYIDSEKQNNFIESIPRFKKLVITAPPKQPLSSDTCSNLVGNINGLVGGLSVLFSLSVTINYGEYYNNIIEIDTNLLSNYGFIQSYSMDNSSSLFFDKVSGILKGSVTSSRTINYIIELENNYCVVIKIKPVLHFDL